MTKLKYLVLSLLLFGCTKEVIEPKPNPQQSIPKDTTKVLLPNPTVTTVPSGIELVTVDSRLKATLDVGQIVVPVVIINYLPTSKNKTTGVLELDRNRTQDSVGQDMTGPYYTLERAKSKIINDKIIEKKAIEEGTRFRDYGTNKVTPYVTIDVVAYINVYDVKYNYIGVSPNYKRDWWNVDFNELMTRVGLQKYVNELGVKEVWFTSFPRERGYLSYNIPESNMSPKIGASYYDVSNGGGDMLDLPRYDKTYVVYGDNGWRGVDTDLHNRGHQLERQMMFFDDTTWSNQFAKVGRAGNTHWCPNSIKDYDYTNTTPVKSDIMTWKPSGGTYVDVNVDTWLNKKYTFESVLSISPSAGLTGNVDYSKDAQTKWFIFWWQSVPGLNNGIVDGTTKINNWWDLFYNFDDAITQKKSLKY